MKHFSKIVAFLLVLTMLATACLLTGCKKDGDDNSDQSNGYKVTFMVEGKQYGDVQTVAKGRRITAPADPTFTNPGHIFTGWYTDASFAEGTKWNFATGIVNADLTLYAGYREITAHVSSVTKAEEACTSKIAWTQAAVSDASAYEGIITDKYGVQTTLTGTVSFDSATYLVTFTPATVPQGGKYTVSVKDTTKTADAAVTAGVWLGGNGTEQNPYLIASALDFTMVNQANVAQGTFFSMVASISLETSRALQSGYVFNGTLLGNGKTITLVNSNCAAIYKVGATGKVYNVNIAGSVSTALFDSVGTMADFNEGRIEKVNTTANVESTAGLAGANGLANALNAALEDGQGRRGIAGGVVGTNLATGVVYNCKIVTSSSSTGTVKAAVGGGTIVGLNYGTVEMCVSNGCLGAWNSKETGKSTSAYSFGGGIVGINAGTVTKCKVDGSGKILAQRHTTATFDAGTNNVAIGGVVGYNMSGASVTECLFAGVRVHGDASVGGIVGLNAGAVSDCYVEGAYQSTSMLVYIGGRTDVGGIVGTLEGSGTVANCFVTANVFAYGGTAYAVAATATNCVYLSANPNVASKNDGTLNEGAAALTVPAGNGNVAVTVAGGSYDGTTNAFVLGEDYLATVNGNTKFNFNGTTVKLNFEGEVLPEETLGVDLYGKDGTLAESTTVAETGAAVAAPVVKGFKFIGWATEANGAVVFAAGAPISLYDLEEFVGQNGKAALYAVYEARQPNEGLIVAVWDKYINGASAGYVGASEDIRNAFLAYLQTLGVSYNVEFRLYSESAIAALGTAINEDGDIDVVIGGGNTMNASNGFDYLLRGDMVFTNITGRRIALMTDTDRAVQFYAWMTGLSDSDITVSFGVTGSTGGTVNELWGTKVDVPTVTPETGFEFLGWATTEGAAEAVIAASKTSISYADVKDLAVSGAVTLYPVFAAEEPQGPTQPAATTLKVSVWTKNGDWVSDAELAAFSADFLTYLAGKGYDTTTLTITYTKASSTKVADLVAEIAGQGFDIVVGCGKSSGDLVYLSGCKATMTYKSATDTAIDITDRYAAQLTENALAAHLYTFLTAAAS